MRKWVGREKWLHVLALASGSFGNLSIEQLTGTVGYSNDDVRGLVRCMKLEHVAHGFYRVAGIEQSWRSRLHLYTMVTSGIAAKCSAGLLLGLINPSDSPVPAAELWVPRRVRLGDHRLDASTCADFDQIEVTMIDGTPCTTPERTLLDIAATQSRHFFLDCYNVALRRRMVTLDRLRTAAEHDSRRRGRRPMMDAIESLTPTDRPPQSEWSLWADRRLRAGGLPAPLLEYRITDEAGFPIATVDLFWPEYRVALELDGRPFHDRHAAFERDRARDAQLAAAGVVVVRMTWSQYQQPGYLLRIMSDVLRQRGWRQTA